MIGALAFPETFIGNYIKKGDSMNRLRLIAISLSLALYPQSAKPTKPVALDSAVLRLVDGTSMICIEQVFSYAQNLIILSSGAKNLQTALRLAKLYDFPLPYEFSENTSGPTRFGLLPYQGTYKTMQELTLIEKELGGMDSDLTDSFEYLKQDFELLSIEYLAELQKNKAFMTPLIKNWSIVRNRPNSILLQWSSIANNEKEALSSMLTNFSISATLVEDLLLFLSDLVQNCPKSHKAYREGLKK